MMCTIAVGSCFYSMPGQQLLKSRVGDSDQHKGSQQCWFQLVLGSSMGFTQQLLLTSVNHEQLSSWQLFLTFASQAILFIPRFGHFLLLSGLLVYSSYFPSCGNGLALCQNYIFPAFHSLSWIQTTSTLAAILWKKTKQVLHSPVTIPIKHISLKSKHLLCEKLEKDGHRGGLKCAMFVFNTVAGDIMSSMCHFLISDWVYNVWLGSLWPAPGIQGAR